MSLKIRKKSLYSMLSCMCVCSSVCGMELLEQNREMLNNLLMNKKCRHFDRKGIRGICGPTYIKKHKSIENSFRKSCHKQTSFLTDCSFFQDMILSGKSAKKRGKLHITRVNFLKSIVEIRNMDVEIVDELVLCSSCLMFINCHITTSNADADAGMIKACEGGRLVLANCEVDNCRIYMGTELPPRVARIWSGSGEIKINSGLFCDTVFRYTSPTENRDFIRMELTEVVMNACKLPSLKASLSSVKSSNCSFDNWIVLKHGSLGKFTNCEIGKVAAGNKASVRIVDQTKGKFINCRVGVLDIFKESELSSFADSFATKVLVRGSSKVNMENATIESETECLTVSSKSSLNALDLTIHRVLDDGFPSIAITGSSHAKFGGQTSFILGSNVSRDRADIIVRDSRAFFSNKISANLLPNIFVFGGRVLYPGKTVTFIENGNMLKFHDVLKTSIAPEKSEEICSVPSFPFLALGDPRENTKISRYGHLFSSSVTLEDMSKGEIAFARSMVPSKGFVNSKGIASDVLSTKLFFKVHNDICPICREETPCNAVAIPCGHTYHIACYRSMVDKTDVTNCAVCRHDTDIVATLK